jgi:hypothetical protein
MEFMLIALALYLGWCIVVQLREESLHRLHDDRHDWRCYLMFPLWPLLAPVNVLAYGAGPFGGNHANLARFEKTPKPIPLSLRVKIPLIFISLGTLTWSLYLLFGASRALFVIVFLICHEGSHALWGLRRRVHITGVGGLPFLGAFVAFGKGTPPELMGEIALAGLLGGLLALPLAWLFADPIWNVYFALNVTLLNALPWGPLDGKKCWLALELRVGSLKASFYRRPWTSLCVGAYILVEGLSGLIK